MRPHSRASFYPNTTSDQEAAGAVARAHGPVTYARLQEIKARYDPQNLFRLDQNITPA
jgi:FAD/FMN-containing dehydrogenase